MITCVLAALTVSPSVLGDPAADFRALVQRSLPSQGCVEVFYAPSADDTFGASWFGYDAKTGAWFRYGGDVAFVGCTPEGMLYHGTPQPGSVQVLEHARPGSDGPVEIAFPFLILKDILQRPELVRSIDPAPGGGFVVRVRWPGGSRENFPGSPKLDMDWLYTVDDSGRMVRIDSEPRAPNHPEIVEYESRTDPSSIPIVRTLHRGKWTLRSRSVQEVSDSALFQPARIESLAIQSKLDTLRGTVPQTPDPETPDVHPAGPKVAVPARRGTSSSALVILGGIVAALGATAWILRARRKL